MDIQTDNFEKAYNYAIYLLSLKLRTEGELREKMRGKKYELGIVDKVIGQLKANNYLDDRKYAEVYLENLKKYKNFGYYGIKKKLIEKRLPSDIIESVLNEGLSLDDEKIIGRRFLAKNKTDDKNKTAARMKARGFRGEVIAKLAF